MIQKALLSIMAALLLADPATASLKDLAKCDPLRKDMHCPPDRGFGRATGFDFAKASWKHGLNSFWTVDDDTARDRRRLDFGSDANGLAVGVWKTGEAPTLTSRRYLLFGKVSVSLKAAKGPGLVTALVLKSDSGDEIDWELLGAFDKQATSNYFHDGKALFNTYNTTYHLNSSSFDDFHTYTVEWTDQLLAFSIDGQRRKSWRPGDIPPDRWPQTPMQVKIGLWTVARSSEPGEIAWAGGLPDWASAPHKAYFRSLELDDYVGACAETDGPVEYRYDERSSGWRDIVVHGCRRLSRTLHPLPGGPRHRPGSVRDDDADADAATSAWSSFSAGLAAAAASLSCLLLA